MAPKGAGQPDPSEPRPRRGNVPRTPDPRSPRAERSERPGGKHRPRHARATKGVRPADLVFYPTPACWGFAACCHYDPLPRPATSGGRCEAGLTTKPHRDRRRERRLTWTVSPATGIGLSWGARSDPRRPDDATTDPGGLHEETLVGHRKPERVGRHSGPGPDGPSGGRSDGGDGEHGDPDGLERALRLARGGAGGDHVVADHDVGAAPGLAVVRRARAGHRPGEVGVALPASSPAWSATPGRVRSRRATATPGRRRGGSGRRGGSSRGSGRARGRGPPRDVTARGRGAAAPSGARPRSASTAVASRSPSGRVSPSSRRSLWPRTMARRVPS